MDLFTNKGVPLIHPDIVDKLEAENRLTDVYNEKMKF